MDINQLTHLAQDVGLAINSLTKFTDLLKEIKESLDHLRLSQEHNYMTEVRKLKEDLTYLRSQMEAYGLPKINTYEKNYQYIISKTSWPIAVDYLPDESERASNILDLIVLEFLEGVKFLDFGCGKGYVTLEAAKRGAIAIGYDIKQQWKDNPLLTTDLAKIQETFDVILLYDVLDHCQKPEEILAFIKDILSPRGKVYIRCHPWCSKHGTHLYKTINKAYLHLILDTVELTRLGGHVNEPILKITHPLATYRSWFGSFNIINEFVITEEVDDFFKDEVLWSKISAHWTEDPTPYLKIQFVDYILEPKEAFLLP